MKTIAIIRIAKVIVMGLIVLMTACTPLIAVQPIGEVPSATSLPTIASSPSLEPTTMPTLPPTIVPTEPPTATSVPVITGCQDSAQYIGDDGLDGTTYAPNTPFTKIWRVKNSGTCTWDSSYLVFYISGATMSQSPAYMIVPRGQTVAPGQTVDISLGMTSPPENGSYRADWGIKQENGPFLPVQGGVNGKSFYVKLKVDDGTAAGNITDASIAIEREEGSGAACTVDATYFVYVSITADGPATADYEINSTAGQIPAGYFQTSPTGPVSVVVNGSLIFDQADTKGFALRFAGPYPYPDDITVNLQVNGGEWHSAKLACQ
jgi:hypothetical protein